MCEYLAMYLLVCSGLFSAVSETELVPFSLVLLSALRLAGLAFPMCSVVLYTHLQKGLQRLGRYNV